uniref:FLYWCH-type domain-containing protein n=1 Tax=Angiostrongylus cantonensis TaxID=6313 RepID=A0A0K0D0R7_ANGCA
MYFDNTTVVEELNMNLPDLLSRAITFTNGSKMYLCFSKRCRKQLCFEGHLYNIDGFVKPTNWNLWRCANPSCSGAIRTSPNITELRVREPHSHLCRPEDIQIRLRITVYDLRLMAEFTDLPLDALYHLIYFQNSVVFLPLKVFSSYLELHFGYDFHGFQSLCMNCNAEFRSMPEIPSQDQLLEHIFFDHNKKAALTSRFTFDDPGLFEQWIRELQYHSKYRLKKMCLHDEHMYYLCQNDVRHFKSNHTRSAIPDMHCTAFVRVHDWRLIIQREVNEVVVDYCLEHIFHNGMCLSVGCCFFF